MLTYEIIPDKLYIRSNVDRILHFTFGEVLKKTSNINCVQAEYILETDKTFWKDIKKKMINERRFHYFWFCKKYSYYERQVFPGIVFKMLIDHDNVPKIYFNEKFRKYAIARVNNIFPPGAYLSDILVKYLIENNIIPLPAAAGIYKKSSIILAGAPDTGKTITTLELLKKEDYYYMGEDIIVLDYKGIIYAVPWTNTFRHYDYGVSLIGKILGKINHLTPLIGVIGRRTSGHITDIFLDVKLESKIGLDIVLVLAINKNINGVKITPLSLEDINYKLLSLFYYEFTFYRNPLFIARDYFIGDIKLKNLLTNVQNILYNSLKGKRFYLIEADNPFKFIDCLNKVL
ncbi:hypothetical protein FHQ18_07765 [Deferribacter autotrophicus]|uniref:Uncharacterized protein n=1 Tax=Deferribacter autotrophicus TaxID=500465 RepID=A0A5A8F3M6_9BACT|nr:hypothetical protein [Deferribacter autotrophicus]KAA0257633.1 hypothetical protein FHQ18_07765 [Deferribacter autotrophicus]